MNPQEIAMQVVEGKTTFDQLSLELDRPTLISARMAYIKMTRQKGAENESEGNSSPGRISPVTRARMKAAWTPERRAAMSAARKGRKPRNDHPWRKESEATYATHAKNQAHAKLSDTIDSLKRILSHLKQAQELLKSL